MPFKLRLLLFYLNYFAKQLDYKQLSAPQVRAINENEVKKIGDKIDFPAIAMSDVLNRQVTMRDGATIPVRIYYPTNEKKLPVIVFYHGGGFVTRSIASHDKVCRRIAKLNNAVVVSVGYRLAPEFKFPIPLYDSFDATVWVVENAPQLSINSDKLVVMGDSAGGNLATGVCILSRNLGGPKITYQVLIYPTTDARLNHPSIDKYGKGYFLTKDVIKWFVNHYQQNDADILNPLMSPLLEKDLSNLPPAFVTTAENDPLKDEGKAYAKKLKEAGNSVLFKEYKGMVHGFLNLAKITTKKTMELNKDIQNYLAGLQ